MSARQQTLLADRDQHVRKSPAVKRRVIFTRDGGFTLVELLITVAIVAVLAVLLFAASSIAVNSARKADSLSVMRNIGLALAAYTGENNRLPGPLHYGQFPQYSNKPYQMITYLWPYLRESKPKPNEVLLEYVPKHWRNWLNKSDGGDKVIYSLSPSAAYGPPGDRASITLWGYPGGASVPAVWAALVSQINLSDSIALTDAFDKDDTSKPRLGEIQNYTTRLFLDWHADTVKQEIIKK